MNGERETAHFVSRIPHEFSQARERRGVSTAVANAAGHVSPDLTPWDTRATKPQPASIWLLAFIQRLRAPCRSIRFGHLFRVTTFGESHGPAIGCVVDGCPPRIPLTEADIQPYLDRRRPGQSRFTTQRQEPDAVKILSGVFRRSRQAARKSLPARRSRSLIDNVDQRSKDYSAIKDKYRPGHADYTYDVKYGLRDYRGGGRQSARETAMRVAAGAVARKVVPGLNVRARIGADGAASHRSRALGLGRGRAQSVLLSRTPRPRRCSAIISTACARAARRSAR